MVKQLSDTIKWCLLILMFSQSQILSATIRTVCNNPSTIAQFNSIQSAINSCVSGDTVFVHGSTLAYDGFFISDKRIILIGPGFRPTTQTALTATVTGSFDIYGSASKKTEVHGFVFNGDFRINSSIDTMYFYRNNFDNFYIAPFITVKNITFKGNYFRGAMGSHPATISQNFIYENNIFDFTGNCILSFNNAANSNILFSHNLFFSGNGNPVNTFADVINVLFVNNIFVERNFGGTLTQSTFQNNITFNCSPNNPWSSNGNINGGGNLENMDPQMTDQANVNSGSAFEISNFTIAAGPANNSGSDGKDMGLLYDAIGLLNWIHGRNARLPSVVSMTITNPVLVTGTTLNISLQARKNE